jgi:UDP-glucose 4-epimerase
LKILITGIAGFLGKNLIKTLNQHQLFGLDIQEGIIDDVPVFSANDLEKIDIQFDVLIICHAAVASGTTILSNDILYNVNVSLTEKIVAKFKDAFVIYISTASIYDVNISLIQENSNINPQTNYAISKLWSERIVLANAKSLIIRLSSLYGNGMKENTIIPNYVNQALSRGKIEVWGKGERMQNYIHVDEACEYVKLAIENFEKIQGKTLLVVSKKEYSNNELAQIIADETKAEIAYSNNDTSKSLRYNNHVTSELLGFKSQLSFESQIQEYIKWKKEQF